MKDKKNVVIISVILAVVFSLSFLLVDITADFIIAYLFGLLGIAALLICTFMMLKKKGSYPWIATIPMQALRYFIIEVAFSFIVVVLEQLQIFTLPSVWFVVIQAIILAIFAIRIVLLRGGAEHLDVRESEIKAKTSYISSLKTEIDLLINRTENSELKSQLKKLSEKIRYSDPMSAPVLAPIEAQLLSKAGELKGSLDDSGKAKDLIKEISLLLEERNVKCKNMKGY